jgi:hypothetical protein
LRMYAARLMPCAAADQDNHAELSKSLDAAQIIDFLSMG